MRENNEFGRSGKWIDGGDLGLSTNMNDSKRFNASNRTYMEV